MSVSQRVVIRILILVVGFFVALSPTGAFAQSENETSPGNGPNWDSMTGTWTVETAERNGEALSALIGVRYFIEPGLMRWANPEIKSKVTNLPVMMGRLLKHVDGNNYRTEALYPPAENGDIEIAVDGEAMIMIVKTGPTKPELTITMRRKHKRCPKPPENKMLDLAKEAYKAKNIEAVYQFSQLQLINFPNDKQAALLLADSRLQTALDMKAGFNSNELQQIRAQALWALERYPDAHRVRHKLGAFLYRFMIFEGALEEFGRLEDAGQFTADSMLKHAQSLARLNKRDEAIAVLEEMVGYDTESLEFNNRERITEVNGGFLLLANSFASEGNKEEAIAIVDEFVKRFPDDPKPYLDRGRLYLGLQQNEEALKNFSTALEIAPDDREALLVNIEVRLREEGDEPDKLLETAIEKHGRDQIILVLAATRAGLKRDFEKALALVDEGLLDDSANQSLVSLKIQLLAEKGDIEAASAMIQELPKTGTPPAVAQLMQAKLFISAKQFSKATRMLAAIDPKGLPDEFPKQVNLVRSQLQQAMDAAASSSISEETNAGSAEGSADSSGSGSSGSGSSGSGSSGSGSSGSGTSESP